MARNTQGCGRIEGARPGAPPRAATPGEFRRRSSRRISTARGTALPVPRPRPRAQRQVQLLRRMSPDEIHDAQSGRLGTAEPQVAGNGADPPPRWATSPIRWMRFQAGSATSAMARSLRASARTSSKLCRCSLGEDADRHSIRQRYSSLVRRYHPDKNGGDRSHEVGSPTSSKPANCCERRRPSAIAIRRAQREMVPEGAASSTPRATAGCCGSRAR